MLQVPGAMATTPGETKQHADVPTDLAGSINLLVIWRNKVSVPQLVKHILGMLSNVSSKITKDL